jgi:Protein of unknown function (DUF2865)
MSNVDPLDGKKGRRAWVLGIATGLAIGVLASPSIAQQGFSLFGGFFGLGAPTSSREPEASAPRFGSPIAQRRHEVASHRHDIHVREARGDDQPRERDRDRHSHSEASGSHLAVCVRLCDGSYFQLANSATDDEKNICSAACPDAATDVFHTDDELKDATNADGKKYSALPNAFAYRSRTITDCVCRKGKLGMATIAADQDPTLEQGDIVVTQHGPMVFHGKSDDEHHANFTPIEESGDLDSKVDHYLANADH